MHGRFGYGLAIAALLMLAAGVLSCGSGGIENLGDGWGEDKTNTRVSLSLQPDSIDIDICNSATVGMVANISIQQLNVSLPENNLLLEGYELGFVPNDSGTPTIRGGVFDLSSILPVSGLDLFFMDPGLKAQFLNDINSGQYASAPNYPVYSARYTVYGTDDFTGASRSWGAASSLSFRVGRYSTCVPSIVPASVTVKAVRNPENDTSDDITFYVSGGSAPYTITSSNPLIISSPGVLPIGHTLFTVDPHSPSMPPINVMLTLMDASGEIAIANITIN